MGYMEIAKDVEKYSNKVGTLSFIISGIGVPFNFYFPNIIPLQFISAMNWIILISSIGMIMIFMIHLKNPHNAVGEKCPKCQQNILYTGIRCSNPKCDYKVKFEMV